MRKIIGTLTVLGVLAVASSALAAPEIDKFAITYNASTGDYGVTSCPGSMAGYTNAAIVKIYRDNNNNMGAGTPGAARPIYGCLRSVTVGGYVKYDSFASVSSTCNGRGTGQGLMGYLLTSATDSPVVMLYLCQMTASVQSGGGTWTEYRVATSCSGGTTLETLGYARNESNTINDAGDWKACTASTSPCFGECGADCNGVLGTHYKTSACRVHDQCVVDHGCNIWAIDCLGDFVVAAASWVVEAAKSLIKAILDFFSSLWHAFLDLF